MPDSCPWWLWPNLISLDAPAVAVVWQRFLAAVAGVEVPVGATVVLALVVWGVYLMDRWLDARDGRAGGTDRHRFAARYSRVVAGLMALALLAAGAVAGVSLPPAYLETGAVVAAVSVGYFAVVHLVRSGSGRYPGLKETAVGAVFAAGVAIPLVTADMSDPEWLPGVVAFGGLCGLNCLLISRWEEHPAVAPPGWITLAAGGLAVGAALVADSSVAVAVLTSVGLLAGLDLARTKVSTRVLRVLADAVLLTPLVVSVVFA